jgi:predicted PurR-regulated permease PerM
MVTGEALLLGIFGAATGVLVGVAISYGVIAAFGAVGWKMPFTFPVLGIIAAVVGLPDPVAWGVLGFVLNFLPYIGAGIMELGMFLVGVVTFDSFAYAMIAPLAYIGMAMIEGQFLTPGLVGRKFTLNPLTVFLSMVFWAWLWGPVGAFLAVPLLIIGLVATAHLFPKQEPELPD